MTMFFLCLTLFCFTITIAMENEEEAAMDDPTVTMDPGGYGRAKFQAYFDRPPFDPSLDPSLTAVPEYIQPVEPLEQRSVQPGGIGWAVFTALLIFAAANTLIIGATVAVYKSLMAFLAVVSPPAAATLGSLFHLVV